MQVILRWTVYVPAIALGVTLLGVYWSQAFANLIAEQISTDRGRMLAGIPAGLLLIMPMALVLRWWQVARRSREISYTTESGKVSVNLIAIEEALTRAIEGEPEVKKAHVRVYEDRVKRAVIIEAAATLWEVPNVTERNRACQRLLRRRFAELMPEQSTVEVNLIIHRLHIRPPPSPAPLPSTIKDKKKSGKLITVGELVAPPMLNQTSNLGRRNGTTELPFEPVTDEDLYAGPTYPVMLDDEEGSTGAYNSKPKKS